MNILIFGGSGFVGRHTAALLRQQGHTVKLARRADVDWLRPDAAAARALFAGQEVVINAVGVMSRHAQVLEQIHHHTPALLAAAAKEAGVRCWVQLSALGARADHSVAFVGSKGRGDAAVCASGLHTLIARPSVVYGRGGVSCELFIKLARLPVLMLPGGGRFDLQPVHVNEVAVGLAALASADLPSGTVIDMTGSRVLTLAGYLDVMRQTLHGKGPLTVLPLPLGVLRPLLPLTNVLSNGILSPGSVRLLEEGSCADNTDFARLLGHAPAAAEDFAGMVQVG
ncbi:uncharacterized protein YbjT (DUF2867 family) [Neisseria sp. HSC-16F19]|nr:NAD-dependent epimerase/dehydratase family protein [Neisseria sp. HSC-16F19]MCP2040355.1 uncharacterized protein YbjT (DUF2867 family) [Neisseria sp. HSC-16F19]